MTRLRLNLNNPESLGPWFRLERQERNELFTTLTKLHAMTWEQVFADRGLRWERLLSRQGTKGGALYTIRVTAKFRAVARRDDDWTRSAHVAPGPRFSVPVMRRDRGPEDVWPSGPCRGRVFHWAAEMVKRQIAQLAVYGYVSSPLTIDSLHNGAPPWAGPGGSKRDSRRPFGRPRESLGLRGSMAASYMRCRFRLWPSPSGRGQA